MTEPARWVAIALEFAGDAALSAVCDFGERPVDRLRHRALTLLRAGATAVTPMPVARWAARRASRSPVEQLLLDLLPGPGVAATGRQPDAPGGPTPTVLAHLRLTRRQATCRRRLPRARGCERTGAPGGMASACPGRGFVSPHGRRYDA